MVTGMTDEILDFNDIEEQMTDVLSPVDEIKTFVTEASDEVREKLVKLVLDYALSVACAPRNKKYYMSMDERIALVRSVAHDWDNSRATYTFNSLMYSIHLYVTWERKNFVVMGEKLHKLILLNKSNDGYWFDKFFEFLEEHG